MVLQKEGLIVVPIGYSLLEAIVEIRDKETCYKSVSEGITERMICAGTPYGAGVHSAKVIIVLINLCVKLR